MYVVRLSHSLLLVYIRIIQFYISIFFNVRIVSLCTGMAAIPLNPFYSNFDTAWMALFISSLGVGVNNRRIEDQQVMASSFKGELTRSYYGRLHGSSFWSPR